MTATLTIFTPTYNRAHSLHLCYESLKRQTSSDFIWLIIDDGSVDDTQMLVERWIAEKAIPIRYHYQQNQGMHGAHNTAYNLADTELCVCIDSDDYAADDAVETIVSTWKTHGCDRYGGMVGFNAYSDGSIVGEPIPDETIECRFATVFYQYRHDKKYVYRRKVFNSYPPYPVYPDEKLTPLSSKYFLIDDDYCLLVIHKILCYVEYMEDGSTRNIFNHYRRNMRGISFSKKIEMQRGLTSIHRFKAAINYVASNIRLGNWKLINESPRKIFTCMAFLPGLLLYLYIAFSRKKTLYNKETTIRSTGSNTDNYTKSTNG